MTQYRITKMNCPEHQLPIQSICCSNHCQLSNICCKLCVPSHKTHAANLMCLSKLQSAIIANLSQQNKLDVITLKQNDQLLFMLSKARNGFNEKEQNLLQSIITIFEEQKKERAMKLEKEGQDSCRRNAKYIQKLSKNKNLEMRIKFSSPKGLSFFQSCSSNSEHLESTPDINIHQTSLTKILTDFIKLQISKEDALKISQSHSDKKGKQVFKIPPPSPSQRKHKY